MTLPAPISCMLALFYDILGGPVDLLSSFESLCYLGQEKDQQHRELKLLVAERDKIWRTTRQAK